MSNNIFFLLCTSCAHLTGRTASVRGLGVNEDLVVNPGAYRFETSSSYPINQWIIQSKYALDSRPYETGSALRVITDENGIQIGFETFGDRMADQFNRSGGTIYHSHHVSSIQQSTLVGGKTLTVQVTNSDDSITTCTATITGQVILNLAMKPTLDLLRASTLPDPVTSTMEEKYRDLLVSMSSCVIGEY